MTDYRKLLLHEKTRVDMKISKEFRDEIVTNPNNGYSWNEREHMFNEVHNGYCCAECFMNYYTCLCSHEEE